MKAKQARTPKGRLLFLVELMLLFSFIAILPTASASVASYNSGSGFFFPLNPARIGISSCNLGISPVISGQVQTLDFESAPSYPNGCPAQKSQPIESASGLPTSGITAVVLNVTATDTSDSNGGSLSFWRSSNNQTQTSNISFKPGETIASEVTVATTSSGTAIVGATLSNSDSSPIQVTLDIEGFYSSTNQSGDTYVPLSPAMVAKTNCGQPFGEFSYGGNETGSLELSGSSSYIFNGSNDTCTSVGPSGFPAAGESAAVVSVTVTNLLTQSATQAGSLTVFETGMAEPAEPNILFSSGQQVTNQVIVPANAQGSIFFQAALDDLTGNAIQIQVDVEGYFSATGGSTYMPLNSALVASSTCSEPSGFTQLTSSHPADTLNIVAAESYSYTNSNPTSCQTGSVVLPVAADEMTAVVLDVTAVPQQGSVGYLSVYPANLTGSSVESVGYSSQSTGNFSSTSNEVTVQIPQNGSSSGEIAISASTYPTDLSVDVLGYFTSPTAANNFVAVDPTRICDTRSGQPQNQCTGETIASNSQITVDVAGYGGVPTTGVTSVLLNVVAIPSSNMTCGACFLTVWPAGVAMPAAGSNINYTPGQPISNQVSVLISPYVNGQGGAIDVYAASGPLDIAIDVAGYYTPSGGSSYVPVTPARICDTRSGNTTQCSGKTLSANTPLTVNVDGQSSIPTSGVTAVVAKVTALNATATGFLRVWPSNSSMPQNTSNINYTAGEIIDNQVTVGVSPYANNQGGDINLIEDSGSLDVLVDVEGYYSSSGGVATYTPVEPVRLADTRCNSGSGLPSGFSKLTSTNPGPESLSLFGAPDYGTQCSTSAAYGSSGLPTNEISAVVLNVTIINSSTSGGWLNVYDTDTGNDIASVSDINYTSGEVVAMLVTVQVSSSGTIGFATSQSSPSLDIIVDLEGYFMTPAGNTFTPVTPALIGSTLCSSPSGFTQLTSSQPNVSLPIDGAFSYSFSPPNTCASSSAPILPPTGISAVMINLTAVVPAGTSSGSLSLLPSLGTGTNTSLSYPANTTSNSISVNNQVTVEVGTNGDINVSATSYPLDVTVDVVGYFSPSGGLNYVPLNPEKIAMSNNSSCLAGSGEPSGFSSLQNGSSEILNLSGSPSVYDPSSCNTLGASGLPDTGVGAVVLNVTATDTSNSMPGALNVYPTSDNGASGKAPPSPTINVLPGSSAASEVTLPTQESANITSVSCLTTAPSTTFCMAVDSSGNALQWNGSNWSSPTLIDSNGNLSSVSCLTTASSTTFCMAVDSSGNALQWNGSNWSSPTLIDSSGNLSSVSCVSSTFCMAVDSNGYLLSWNGSAWSSPTFTDYYSFTGVSCVSGSTSCIAVDSAGNAFVTSTSTWYFNVVPGPATGVSCFSTNSCMVVDADGNYAYWNGTSWSSGPTKFGEPLSSVSCYSATSCMAVDKVGDAIEANYQSGNWTWIPQTGIDANAPFNSISCVASTIFCDAVDGNGNVLEFTGSTWSQPLPIDSNRTIVFDATTGSANLEISVDIDGYFTASSVGSKFVSVTPSEVASTPNSQCSSASPSTFYDLAYSDNLDPAGNPNGSYVNLENSLNLAGAQSITPACDSNGSSGIPETGVTSAVLNVTATTGPTSNGAEVSIYPSEPGVPTNSDITLPDGGGTATKQVTVQTSLDGQVIVGAKLPQNAVQSVSCASASMCVAVDQSGNSVIWNGTNWTSPMKVDENGALNTISCVSGTTPTFCIAMGTSGYAFYWNGTTWSVWTTSGWEAINATPLPVPLLADPNGNVESMSCTTPTFCMAVDSSGNAVQWTGSNWSSLNNTNIDPNGNLTSISCYETSFCMAIDKTGYFYTWTGAKWTKAVILPSHGIFTKYFSVSCSSSTTCVVGGNDGYYAWGDGSSGWSSTSWPTETQINTNNAHIDSISCISTSSCFAVAGDGTTYTITGASTWAEIGSQPIDNGNSLDAISCVSVSFCVSVDGAKGDALTYSGSSWLSPISIDLTQVQVVVDVVGYYIGSTGGQLQTVAGLAEPYSWSGSVATGWALGSPTGVGSDSNGNVYISDAADNVVWQVNRAGLISDYAGTDSSSGSYSGDGGPATLAKLNSPGGIAVDKSGNVFIADTGNSLIRMVPVSGNSYFGKSMTAGDIYSIAGGGTASGCSATGVSSTSVKLSSPTGIAVDASGNIYISDSSDNCIRMVPNVSGTYFGTSMTAGDIYTIAGGGTASGCSATGVSSTSVALSSPTGIAVDASGNIYISDSNDNCIRMVPNVSGTYFGTSMTEGYIYTIAGNGSPGSGGDGGAATVAEINDPSGIAVDQAGNVVFADKGNCKLRLISGSGLISTIGGTGNCGEETRSGNGLLASIEPTAVAITNSGDLLFADTEAKLVQEIVAALPDIPYSSNYPVNYTNPNSYLTTNTEVAVNTTEQDAYEQYTYNSIQDGTTYYNIWGGDPNTYVDLSNGQIAWIYNSPGTGPVSPSHLQSNSTTNYSNNVLIVEDGPRSPVFHAVYTNPLFNGIHGNENGNGGGYFSVPSSGACSPNPTNTGSNFVLAPVGNLYDGKSQVMMSETVTLGGYGGVEVGSCVATINSPATITDYPTYSDITSVDGGDMVTNQVDCSGQPSPISFQDGQVTSNIGGSEYTYVYGDYACQPYTFLKDASGNNSGRTLYNSDPTGTASWNISSADSTKDITSVSCPATTFCAAVDSSGNVLITSDPESSSPTWSVTNIDGTNDLTSVSCASASFCMAVNAVGNSIESTAPTGGTASWNISSADSTKDITSVSCPTTTFCAAVDSSGNVLITSDPESSSPIWSVTNIDGTNDLTSVSCASASFCMAVDAVGNAIIWNGSTWNISSADSTNDITSVSCPTTTLCVMGDTKGNVVSWNGSTNFTSYAASPITPNVNGSRVGLSAISCVPNSACIMTDTNGDTYAWYGTSWITLASNDVGNAIDGISCATVTMCLAVDKSGNGIVWNGSSWSTPITGLGGIDSGHLFNGVSCTSGPICIAVDSYGNAFVNNSSSWSAPTRIDTNGDLTSVSCPSPSLCVAVDSSGYALATIDPGSSPPTWSAPTRIDTIGNLTSVSCPSSSFCVAVDSSGYALITTNPGSSVPIWSSTLADPNGWLTSVSCPTTTFCATVDSAGNLLTYNGSSWSAPTAIDPNILNSISCTSSSLCVAVDRTGNVVTSTDPTGGSTSWSVSGVDTVAINSVSCFTVSTVPACVSVDNAGNELYGKSSNSGLTWSWSTSSIDGTNKLTAVSCVSDGSYCVAGDGVFNGTLNWPDYAYVARVYGGDLTKTNQWSYYYYNSSGVGTWSQTGVMPGIVGATWSSPSNVDGTNDITSVSCGNTSFCVAVDSSGNEVSWNGTSWSSPSNVDGTNDITSVSCASASFCVAVDSSGNEVSWNGSSWSSPVGIDTTNKGITSVSCASASFCVAVDSSGYVISWNGSSWSSPAKIDSNGNLTSVSCPSAYFCIAVDDAGYALTWNTTNISSIQIDNKGNPTSISCATSSSCVVVDSWGYEMSLSGTQWSSVDYSSPNKPTLPAYLDSSSGLTSVSCPSPSLCVAVDNTGNEFTFSNGQWLSGPTSIDGTQSLTGVSCLSSGFCYAVDKQGYSLETSNVTDIVAGALIDGSVAGNNLPIEDSGAQFTVEAVGGSFRMVDDWDGLFSVRVRYSTNPAGPFSLSDTSMPPESADLVNAFLGNNFPPPYGMVHVSRSNVGTLTLLSYFAHEVPALESNGNIVIGYDVNSTFTNQSSGITNNYGPRFIEFADNG